MKTRPIAELEPIASRILTAALKALNFKYDTRQQIAAELVAHAEVNGLSGDEVRWAAGWGLAKCGYGGGL